LHAKHTYFAGKTASGDLRARLRSLGVLHKGSGSEKLHQASPTGPGEFYGTHLCMHGPDLCRCSIGFAYRGSLS